VKKTIKIEMVVWEDAEADSGWVDPEEEWRVPLVHSVGVVSVLKDAVVVVGDFSIGEKDVGRRIRIPRGMIRERSVIHTFQIPDPV
tara:strand:+ start:654 stop:911 length:258 start_codon:yes stop_codon:yes gene_type:complete